ncbi:MAG: acyl carrier protein [Spirochaetes bacterium]|nr:acyl carrier protein [Spirochaetota bacterium]
MNSDEVYSLIKEYLVNDFEIPESKISRNSNLFDDLELDSIDALDMIATLESKINLKIDEEQLKKIITVDDIVNYVVNNVSPELA